MRSYWWGLTILLTAAALPAAAGEPGTDVQPAGLFGGQRGYAQPCPCPGYTPGIVIVPGQTIPGTIPGATPSTTQPGAEQPPVSSLESPAGAGSAFAGAGEAGTGAVASAAQYTFGDLIGLQGRAIVPVPGRNNFGRAATAFATVPIVNRYGGIKIADLESPRPADRVYFGYNFYYNANPGSRDGLDRIDVHRELVGFEKTVLGGNASFGMRLPFNQLTGGTFSDANQIGDLSMTFKYALINNPNTGNVLSGGLVLTVPTGERGGLDPLTVQRTPGGSFTNPVTGAVTVFPGTFTTLLQPDLTTRSVLFQPWAGSVYNFGPLYLISFTSLIAPTDSRDPTVWTSSIAVGYNLIQPNQCGCDNRLIQGLSPVVELHGTTPFNHRHPTVDDPIFLSDQLNLTTGAYVTIKRFIIGGAVCVPLVGPKPFDVEAITNIQFRF